ncbi:MAG: hypothetical protein ACD_21C00116G0001 [uncultured bacterium]|nr:MAG: hypothetical protein ACD_21C00116G0001 [uncultured bacterium]
MPSRIYIICNSYESGFGHGMNEDGLDLSKTPHSDPECGEAYQIGYEAGLEGVKMHRNVGNIAELLPPNVISTPK